MRLTYNSLEVERPSASVAAETAERELEQVARDEQAEREERRMEWEWAHSCR